MDDATLWALAMAIGLLAGFVKGATGFALPMILISGLGSFLAPDRALAMLILPTLVSNLWQVARFGLRAAAGRLAVHWRFVAITLVFILAAGQLVAILPPRTILLILGGTVLFFTLIQLFGWTPHLPPGRRRLAEAAAATLAGISGGLSGVWGAPTILYLTALETPKADQMQITGVVFGTGSVMLLLAHVRSGVMNAETWPLSAIMVLPVLAGMVAGFGVHDRLDQRRFRQATLALLILAGLNLIRRGLTG